MLFGTLTNLFLALFLVASHGTACGAEDHPATSQSPNSSTSQIKTDAAAKQREARETVEKYWSSAPQDRYVLLAENYKRDLKRLGIADATAYAKETENSERVWRRRTYQKIDVSQKRDAAQVVVLVEWEQEGYQGVMTYIFDLVVEDARWKIGFIMH